LAPPPVKKPGDTPILRARYWRRGMASFDPQVGHEQAGHRRALVLSPAAYNEKTSLMVCCPMTTQTKNYRLRWLSLERL
jgi:hypothetical protein